MEVPDLKSDSTYYVLRCRKKQTQGYAKEIRKAFLKMSTFKEEGDSTNMDMIFVGFRKKSRFSSDK